MKITADTNILVRAVVRDEEAQATAAARLLQEAELIAVSLPCLCEFVWVLRRVYKMERLDVGAALRVLLDSKKIVVDRPAVEAGLDVLSGGGDFADGVIAYQGKWLGGERFVSFDERAVRLLSARGVAATLLQS